MGTDSTEDRVLGSRPKQRARQRTPAYQDACIHPTYIRDPMYPCVAEHVKTDVYFDAPVLGSNSVVHSTLVSYSHRTSDLHHVSASYRLPTAPPPVGMRPHAIPRGHAHGPREQQCAQVERKHRAYTSRVKRKDCRHASTSSDERDARTQRQRASCCCSSD